MNDLKRKKREDKERINSLFKRYVTYREEKVLWKLVIACEGIIKACLNKYESSHLLPRWYDDIFQDVMIKLFHQLNNPKRRTDAHPLEKQLVNPFAYLFFMVRSIVHFFIDKYNQQFGQEILFPDLDKFTMNDTCNPEILYIFKYEIPQELFDTCKKVVENDIGLRKYPEAKLKKIRMIKQMVEDAFGVVVND